MYRSLFTACLLTLSLNWLTPAPAQVVYSGKSIPSRPPNPANSIGVDNSWYLDLLTGNIYGPKTQGLWPLNPVTNIFGGNSFIATNYTAASGAPCTWDATHDPAPCIQATINAANAANGGTVILPCGNFGLGTGTVGFTNPYNNVNIQACGVGSPPIKVGNAWVAGTKFTWIGSGPVTATASTVGLATSTVTSTGTATVTLSGTVGTVQIPSFINIGNGGGFSAAIGGFEILSQVSGTPGGDGVYNTNQTTTVPGLPAQLGTTSVSLSGVSGTIAVGEYVGISSAGQSVFAGTKIIGQTSGTPGGAGVYTTQNPTTLTAASMIIAPVAFDNESPAGFTTNSYARGFVIDCNSLCGIAAKISGSSFAPPDIGGANSVLANIFYAASGAPLLSGAQGNQFNMQLPFSLMSSQLNTSATAAGIWIDSDWGAAFDVSIVRMSILLAYSNFVGDGIVFADSDNNFVDWLNVGFVQMGSPTTGTQCVMADTSYVSTNGWQVNASARHYTIWHDDCRNFNILGPFAQNAALHIYPAEFINIFNIDLGNGVAVPGNPTAISHTTYGTNATGYYSTNENPVPVPVNLPSTQTSITILSTPGTGNFVPTINMVKTDVFMVGGGGGGGGGALQASGSSCSGGAGGGGGGVAWGSYTAAQIGTNQHWVVGTGGTGGIAASTNNTAGGTGGLGGNTSFGTGLSTIANIANLGCGGAGGQLAGGSGGGGAGGVIGACTAGSGATGGTGQIPGTAGGSGAGSLGNSEWGGATGGAGGVSGAAGSFSGSAVYGPTGGGAGGGVGPGPTAFAGGNSGYTFVGVNSPPYNFAAGGAINTVGGAGINSAQTYNSYGSGGGGGGGAVIGVAGAGGAGGYPGGGGGGGGCALDGLTAGAGGPGANGIEVITQSF